MPNPLRWQVTVPLSLLYVAFIFYLSGPIGLYTGHGTLLKVYYYRVIVIEVIVDLIFSILWFFTAITYFAGFYVHGKTLKFFRTRWNGYDDGDLVLATKLRAQGLPVAVYNMREYFTFFKLEHESESQLQKEQRAATGAMKSSGKSAKLNSGNSVTG
ncbi:unnamed protein product [Thelazia callipaeda]|uniref:Poly-beta-1,6-N-acetyl-D-glucosamine biosynthesis protein PgaD n=1 Tax=Thelazia callipaeda TaxID=103827 RepID=A0A0N5D1F3_THECL|nr:unnamed protein product [Thelazia callipaeda]